MKLIKPNAMYELLCKQRDKLAEKDLKEFKQIFRRDLKNICKLETSSHELHQIITGVIKLAYHWTHPAAAPRIVAWIEQQGYKAHSHAPNNLRPDEIYITVWMPEVNNDRFVPVHML